jgi:hypothetical protein
MINPEHKKWIDNASLEDLLKQWRFGEIGHPIFEGETGKYFSDKMFDMRDSYPEEWVKVSKKIGFEAAAKQVNYDN